MTTKRTTCAATASLLLGVVLTSSMQTSLASEATADELVQSALNLDASPAHGKALYAVHCQTCHGRDAVGDARRAVPALAHQRQAYLIMQLADFFERDRSGPPMHAVVTAAEIREPQSWTDLAAYLNALRPARKVEHGDGKHLDLGEGTFREQCASCHESDGRGDPDGFTPSIRDQHYSYLLKQLHGIARGARRNIEHELRLYVSSLADDELSAVADYASRLKGREHNHVKMRSNGIVGD